jgi:hypothetical protein
MGHQLMFSSKRENLFVWALENTVLLKNNVDILISRGVFLYNVFAIEKSRLLKDENL